MRRHVTDAERLVPPLHLDEVHVAVHLDDTVDLLDDPFAGVGAQSELALRGVDGTGPVVVSVVSRRDRFDRVAGA
jgi:hypothetical protein